MHKKNDANHKTPSRYRAPELIHGLCHRYCEECGMYHATMSNVELVDNFSASPVKSNAQDRRRSSGRRKARGFKLS